MLYLKALQVAGAGGLYTALQCLALSVLAYLTPSSCMDCLASAGGILAYYGGSFGGTPVPTIGNQRPRSLGGPLKRTFLGSYFCLIEVGRATTVQPS
ncbi:hypothetical protein F5Y05DRAFT_231746 [Hypoxylon sp. FL0543]|nr:hypothetical protein F5Y05DRAFT_231746 [Hypoxylon sp. FL0543]